MKNISNICILLFTIIMLSGTKATAQISKAEIRATGLTCSMCSNAIYKQLKSMPEVADVETDLNTNTFTVKLKDGNTASPKAFKDNVEKAGFFIGSLILTTPAETLKQDAYVVVDKNSADSKSEIQIQVLDKGYVTEKEFRKLSKSLKKIETYNLNNENDFHIKIIK